MMWDLIKNINWANSFNFFWKIFPGLLLVGYAMFSLIGSLRAERGNRDFELISSKNIIDSSKLQETNDFLNEIYLKYNYLRSKNINSMQFDMASALGVYICSDYFRSQIMSEEENIGLFVGKTTPYIINDEFSWFDVKSSNYINEIKEVSNKISDYSLEKYMS